ncbi:MAG: kelch repeat-containing protein, partial [Planctomycetota bacterium]
DQPPEVLAAVRNLAQGHWYEVPNTKMESVKPNPVPAPGSIGGVIGAWSGGALDTKRDRLIVWGGGHTDYSGNEIYVFDLATLKWSRITDPSPFPPGESTNPNDEVQHPDGSPISRHTDNYIAYIPDPVARFFVGGGSGLWQSGQFEDDNTYLFDFDTLQWETKSRCPVAFGGAFCAVAADGRVWQHGAVSVQGLAVYDATTDKWTSHSDEGWFSFGYTCDVDTARNRLLAVGKARTVAWDLDNPNQDMTTLQTTGDVEAEDLAKDSAAPGLVYHPGSDRLIAWHGGASVYALDLDTNVWTKIDTTGSVSPGAAAGTGTFGRFRYSPTSDLFVTVASVRRNVFVYRLPD